MSQFKLKFPVGAIADEAHVVASANGWLSCADTSVRQTIQALASWGLAATAGEGTYACHRHTCNALHQLHSAAVHALAAYINACNALPTDDGGGE